MVIKRTCTQVQWVPTLTFFTSPDCLVGLVIDATEYSSLFISVGSFYIPSLILTGILKSSIQNYLI